jgi:hypothetical protein
MIPFETGLFSIIGIGKQGKIMRVLFYAFLCVSLFLGQSCNDKEQSNSSEESSQASLYDGKEIKLTTFDHAVRNNVPNNSCFFLPAYEVNILEAHMEDFYHHSAAYLSDPCYASTGSLFQRSLAFSPYKEYLRSDQFYFNTTVLEFFIDQIEAWSFMDINEALSVCGQELSEEQENLFLLAANQPFLSGDASTQQAICNY